MSKTGATLRADAQGFVHATSVTIDDKAILIIGPSGVGKSTLALQLIGYGARLISDDRTRVSAKGDDLIAHAPDVLVGVIEARGLGLINTPYCQGARVRLVVDLAQVEEARLPPSRPVTLVANQPVRTIWRVDAPHFPSALFQMIKHGRCDHLDG